MYTAVSRLFRDTSAWGYRGGQRYIVFILVWIILTRLITVVVGTTFDSFIWPYQRKIFVMLTRLFKSLSDSNLLYTVDLNSMKMINGPLACSDTRIQTQTPREASANPAHTQKRCGKKSSYRKSYP